MSRNLVIFSILKTQATTKQQQNSAYSAHSNFNLPKGSFFLNWSLFAVDRKHFQSYLMHELNIYVLSMTKVFYFKKRAANIFAKPHLGDLKLDTIFQLANRFRAKVYCAEC